jgi:hypothetical protein
MVRKISLENLAELTDNSRKTDDFMSFLYKTAISLQNITNGIDEVDENEILVKKSLYKKITELKAKYKYKVKDIRIFEASDYTSFVVLCMESKETIVPIYISLTTQKSKEAWYVKELHII